MTREEAQISADVAWSDGTLIAAVFEEIVRLEHGNDVANWARTIGIKTVDALAEHLVKAIDDALKKSSAP
jgi:hypothetical protein